jgi:hypothetical protein
MLHSVINQGGIGMKNFIVRTICGAAFVLGAALCTAAPASAQAAAAAEPKFYELRTYHAAPGKLAEVKQEFNDWIIPGLHKVGIHPVAYWVKEPGEGTDAGAVVYLMAFKDKVERDLAWDKFRTDPEIAKLRAATNEKIAASGGVRSIAKADIVFMTMADFSPHITTAEGVTLK